MEKKELTKGKWIILERGNTVKQLCVASIEGEKVCSGISPKRCKDALAISQAPNMIDILARYYEEFSVTDQKYVSQLLIELGKK